MYVSDIYEQMFNLSDLPPAASSGLCFFQQICSSDEMSRGKLKNLSRRTEKRVPEGVAQPLDRKPTLCEKKDWGEGALMIGITRGHGMPRWGFPRRRALQRDASQGHRVMGCPGEASHAFSEKAEQRKKNLRQENVKT